MKTWIGLYREAWKWLDGTAASFRLLAPMEPKKDNTDGCAAMSGESWYDRSCYLELNFLCQRKFRFCRCFLVLMHHMKQSSGLQPVLYVLNKII